MRSPFFARRLLPYCICAFLLSALSAGAAGATREQALEILREQMRAHGVVPTVEGLASFLARGWEGAKRPPALPDVPTQKSALITDAWRLLADDYLKVRASKAYHEALAVLARQYAAGNPPLAVLRIIENDLSGASTEDVDTQRERRLDFLQYNGMVALAYFGRSTTATLRVARERFESESRPIVRMTYAQTLALLGDRAAMDDLAVEAARGNAGSSVAAANALYVLFGENFHLHPNLAKARREETGERISDWWARMRPLEPPVDRGAALERLKRGMPAEPLPQDPLQRTLKLASDYADVSNVRGSRTAWNVLEEMEDLPRRLEPILKDELADLDVRREAMRWYVRRRGDDARGFLKKLRKDPNDEIVRFAEELLERD